LRFKKRFRGIVFELMSRNGRASLRIEPETTISLWEGERMDDVMAVAGFYQLE